jgi:hypothetical protein
VTDPQFVAYNGTSTGDFHLKRNSPAVDAGTPQSGPSNDLDGVQRPQGKTWDIGAYELPQPAISRIISLNKIKWGRLEEAALPFFRIK